MSHTYKILKAQIDHNHAVKRDMIDVHVQIFLDKKELDVRRFGFDLETSEKAIRAELDRFVATLDSDSEKAKKNAEHEKLKESADKTIQALNKK